MGCFLRFTDSLRVILFENTQGSPNKNKNKIGIPFESIESRDKIF